MDEKQKPSDFEKKIFVIPTYYCMCGVIPTIEELLGKRRISSQEKTENTAVGIRRVDHTTPSMHKSSH
jgi:hypothetical protein